MTGDWRPRNTDHEVAENQGFTLDSNRYDLHRNRDHPKFWEALCERLERADLAQLHRTGDRQTEERVREELRAIFAARPMAHWAALFAGSQACVTPVLRLEEALAHPHFISRGFSKDPPGQAPQPGEHTQEILQGAGFTADEIATLRSEGAIG